MRRLLLIGIGTGNPEHMTIQGIKALNSADLVLIPRKGAEKEELADVRREICTRFLTNPETRLVEFDLPVRDAANPAYRRGVEAWHEAIAETYRSLLQAHPGQTAALLVWGDPSLYDSTLRIAARLGDMAAPEVIPGITSVQALAASHRIALNTIGNAVQITTGRQLRAGFPPRVDTAVVMLDGECSFQSLPGEDYDIFWGAYLGTPEEVVLSGRLAAMSAIIVETRARLRARMGWIMDIYLLRKRYSA
ncbi:precorrin-6A synthase (deacetylating) [Acetobacteraceae bacterium H6797]|nr:precorrin-6A synthase (deacetylating) [Acetobacteraceae bacterium H6797]